MMVVVVILLNAMPQTKKRKQRSSSWHNVIIKESLLAQHRSVLMKTDMKTERSALLVQSLRRHKQKQEGWPLKSGDWSFADGKRARRDLSTAAESWTPTTCALFLRMRLVCSFLGSRRRCTLRHEESERETKKARSMRRHAQGNVPRWQQNLSV